VVVRAVGPLAELAELALPLLGPGGILVAWKRRGDDGLAFDREVASAARVIGEFGGGPPSIQEVAVAGLLDHRLIVIEKVGPTPAAYPRDPATRRRPT
jgi:16S rRNA (guanine527-N7)-methyltransferase